MTLCDAGPLVAIVDRTDDHHTRCVAALHTLPPGGLLTTWACLAEAMFLLERELGWSGQDELWSFVADGVIRLHPHAEDEWERMRDLMRDYADTPMDLADASIVAAAEVLREQRVFTIDSHFYVYRQKEGQAFEVVP